MADRTRTAKKAAVAERAKRAKRAKRAERISIHPSTKSFTLS